MAVAVFASEPLSPLALAPSPDGRSLYIAEATASQVAVFDVASGTVRRTIPLPDRPTGLALSADGVRLFVTGGVGSGRVHVVDAASGRVTASLGAGHSPNSPTLSVDGRTLYVCSRFGGTVEAIDVNSGAVTARIPAVREPGAAALSADGRHLFVANLLAA